MKKIISLGIASAVCAITAISASAAPAFYDNATGEVVTDGVITVDVKAGEDLTGLSFKVVTEGLEVQSVDYTGEAALKGYDKTSGTFYVSNGDGVVAKTGEVLCTITAKVTAKADEQISISLVDNSGKYTALLPDTAYTATVVGATDTSSETSTGTSSETSTGTSDDEKDPDKSPATGVALAVVPAVLAAAGVVVAKKRK